MTHDKHILRKTFTSNQKVWLFNAKLRLFPGKLLSRCNGPFIVTKVFYHGAVEIQDPKDGRVFKVNGQRLKAYVESISKGGII